MTSSKDHLKEFNDKEFSELKKRSNNLAEISEKEIKKRFKSIFESIEESFPNMNIFEIIAAIYNSQFDFSAVQDFIQTLPTYKDKIGFLMEKKAEFEQNQESMQWVKHDLRNDVLNFGKYCQIELDKLEKLQQIEKENDSIEKADSKNKKDGRGLTRDRAILFLEYLFRVQKADVNKTNRAKAISFVTGYSENTLRNRLSSIYSPKNIKTDKYKKDLRIVRKHFDNLGLTELSKMIDNELEEKK